MALEESTRRTLSTTEQHESGAPHAVGIVGSGFIGREHALSWQKLGVALHVYGGAQSQQLALEVGAQHHDTMASLIAAVETVDVCTPTHLHRDVALAAAAAGRNVICEKPLAQSVEAAQEIADACEAAGVRLFVGQVVRYFPEYAKARDAIREGKVGQIAVMRLARESFAPQRAPESWLFDDERSGGIIGDLMTHDIDYALWTAGPVVRVFAKVTSSGQLPVADHAFAVLTHESGALTHLTASWAQVAPRFRTRMDIAGTTGMLTYDSERSAPILVATRAKDSAQSAEVGLPARTVTSLVDDPFTAQLRDFLRGIVTGAEARSTAIESIAAVRVAAAAQESVRTARAVELGKDLR